jgi:L-seryl-tRNA(Ser) seleniumtransferase
MTDEQAYEERLDDELDRDPDQGQEQVQEPEPDQEPEQTQEPEPEPQPEPREEVNPLRHLPNIDRLLKSSGALDLVRSYGREATRDALRIALDAARQWIRQGGNAPAALELLSAAASWLRNRYTPTLRPVINATGIILHSDLGRIPVSEAAQQMIMGVAASYNTLEYELDDGKRGKREQHIESLITKVTGAEAALVVNNNSAALLLILSVLASGRDVIISRGQLFEINGLRLYDMIVQSGARLVEVGSTNRTNLDDVEQAITPQFAIYLRAHTGNFKQLGATEQPDLRDVAALAHAHNVIAVDDLGNGALLNTARYGLAREPMIQESIEAGFDLVTFSGDKLLGGPQAGIIVGRSALVEKLKRHPLTRALQLDKLNLAALYATFDHYRRGDAPEHIPVWQMLAQSLDDIRARAVEWAQQVGGEVVRNESTVNARNLPGDTLPTYVLSLTVPQPDDFISRLRRHNPPLIARIERDRVLLDPRTVLPSQDGDVVRALQNAFR